MNQLMESLEQRVAMLGAALGASALATTVSLRIGAENELPALQSLAIVGASLRDCRSARSAPWR